MKKHMAGGVNIKRSYTTVVLQEAGEAGSYPAAAAGHARRIISKKGE